jgi:DNA-binding winged helix-turn-helix (wHTH) protein/tetratricopeptide (TPR) repeat protein
VSRTALASQPDIHIGAGSVRPSTCEVVGRSGRREALEPRVMEVLLALIEARGAVLSREALVDACWDGRAVSEDAITRVISKIRRLSEGVAAGDFTIETLPKIGYRLLTATGGPSDAHEAPAGNVRPAAVTSNARLRGRVFASLALVLLLGAAALGVEFWRGRIHGSAADAAKAVPPALAPAEFAAADLETRGRAAVFEGTPAQLERGIGYLREATVRAPQDAHAWGSLAMAQVLTLKVSVPDERPAIMLRVQEAASKALALDRHEGLALAAQVSIEPTFGVWARKDQALARAQTLAPPDTPALLVQRAQFLAAIGRTREATALMEHAAAVAPLLPWIQAARVQLLVDSQRLDEAERVANRALSLWPQDPQVWLARFWLKIASGRASDAVTIAANRTAWPDGASAADMGLAADLARAVGDRSVAGADAVLATYRRRLDRGGPDAGGPAIRAALALGRPQAALDFAEHAFVESAAADSAAPVIGPQRPGEPDTAVLFSAPARQLWADRRFATLMRRSGLVGYWKARGGPDFCSDPAAPGNCVGFDLRRRPG